jgi:hypothetical protein
MRSFQRIPETQRISHQSFAGFDIDLYWTARLWESILGELNKVVAGFSKCLERPIASVVNPRSR